MENMITVSASATYEELRAAQDILNAEIGKIASVARAEGMATVVKLIKEFGFTGEEVNKALSGKGKPGRKAKVKTDADVDGLPKVKRVGKKAAPKYRNPADGTTWTGRGVSPAWIRAHDKSTWDQFLIPQKATGAAGDDSGGTSAVAVAETPMLPSQEAAATVEATPAPATKPIFAA
jgi:DNA-binding protein H-NS